MKKRIIYSAVVFAAFFGLSIAVSIRETKPDVRQLDLKLTGLTELLAAIPNGGTQAIRGVTSFVKGAVDGVDALLLALKNSGVLGYSGTFTFTTPEGLKLKLNTAFNTTITTPDGRTPNYQNSFEVWRASDDAKLLELFFDSATDPAQQDGVMAIWWPAGIDPVNNGGTGKLECVTTGGSADGTMTCTLTGGPWDLAQSDIFQTILVKAVASSTAGTVSVKALAKRSGTAVVDCAGGNLDVYALSFISKTATPNQTTGMWGYNDNSIADTICAGANPFNYSYFNTDVNSTATDESQYFVEEGPGVASASDPAYPTGADVLALFTEMATPTDTYMNLTKVNAPGTVNFQIAGPPGF